MSKCERKEDLRSYRKWSRGDLLRAMLKENEYAIQNNRALAAANKEALEFCAENAKLRELAADAAHKCLIAQKEAEDAKAELRTFQRGHEELKQRLAAEEIRQKCLVDRLNRQEDIIGALKMLVRYGVQCP